MRVRRPDPPREPPDLAWATLIRAELDAQFPRPERLPERFTPRSRRLPILFPRARRPLAVAALAVVLAGVTTTVVARTPEPQVVALFLSSRSAPTSPASPTPSDLTIGTGVATLTPAPRTTAPASSGRPEPPGRKGPGAETPVAPGSSPFPSPSAPAVEPSPTPPPATPVPSPTPRHPLCLLIICL